LSVISYQFVEEIAQVNGQMTYDRKPKFDTKVLREINGLLK
jgi:hypothetical protein